MAGQRRSLASLAGDPVEVVPGHGEAVLERIPLDQIAPTPLNPRAQYGTPEELAELGRKLMRRQLQPVVLVSRAGYLKQFPEHAEAVGKVSYVLVNGERRYRASRTVNLPTIEAVRREDIAASRQDFIDAVTAENFDRENFDPMEEAFAVEAMLKEFKTARAVAERRNRHETWVSQRRSLLRLSPDIQELVSRGAMPVERARELAKLVKDNKWDGAAQIGWWESAQAIPKQPRKRHAPEPEPSSGESSDTAAAATVSKNGTTSAPRDAQGFTAVKSARRSGPLPKHDADIELAPASGGGVAPALPWDSPSAINDLLRRHMTADDRAALCKLLADC